MFRKATFYRDPKKEETSVQHDDKSDVVSVLSVSDEEKDNDYSFIPLADDEKIEQKQNSEGKFIVSHMSDDMS